jgi:site-specific recombinase XerD
MSALRIRDAIDAFLADLERRGKSETTLRNYRADLCALLRSAGLSARAHRLATVAQSHLDGLRLADRSRNRHLSTLRRFCEYLVGMHALRVNPLRGSVGVVLTESTQRPIAPGQIDEILGRIERPRDRALVSLLLGSGVRVSEALALRVRDVNLGAATLTVRRGVARRVSLPPSSQRVLAAYLREREARPNEPLFVTRDGKSLSYAAAHRLFRLYAGDTGLTLRRLRSSAAMSAFDDGATLPQVQRMLGHRHAASTARYNIDNGKH